MYDGRKGIASSALRVAIGFGVGGVVGIIIISGVYYILLKLSGPGGFFMLLGPGLTIPLGVAISGTIGGASLAMGRKVSIGFGIGFLVAGLLFSFFALSQISGVHPSYSLALFYSIAFTVIFGIAGAIGAAFMRLGLIFVLAGAISFGIGGAIGGALSVFSVVWGSVVWLFISLLIAYTIGGGLLGAAVAFWRRSHD